ncbi:cation:proton antiporter [Micromonospora sp. NPDC049175]|uniref:cation:proton antiporter n=1 Tax=Micromonospora sp. NPDC049175 TaxID=3364266 RepID=UPI00371FF785
MPSSVALTTHLLVQLAVVLGACRLAGALLGRLGQPQAVADMIAGFALGPLALGLLAPSVQLALFPRELELAGATVAHPSAQILHVLGQLGATLFMFLVGLSFDGAGAIRHLRTATTTAVASLAAPLVVGGLLGLALAGGALGIAASDDGWFGAHIPGWQAAWFLGLAVAVSAFPVLARILEETGATRTTVGTVSLACAATDDAVAWMMLAGLMATAGAAAHLGVLAVAGGLVYVAVLVALRPLLRRYARWATEGGDALRPAAVGAALVLLTACAATTEMIGLHAVFGAFVCGMVMPRELTAHLTGRIAPLTTTLLLPLFFASAGLRIVTDTLLDPSGWLVLGAVVLVAVVSKGGVSALVARWSGLSWSQSASVGALLNARGMMELVLIDVALRAGLIGPKLYTVLALMTMVTTFAAAPVFALTRRRWPASAAPVDVERMPAVPAGTT